MSDYTKTPTWEPPTRFGPPSQSVTPFKAPNYRKLEVWDDPKIEPLAFLLAVMRSINQPTDRRMEAAKAAAPYCHYSRRRVRTEEERKLAEDKLAAMKLAKK